MRRRKVYIGSVLLAEAVGLLAALLTRRGVELYEAAAVKPALTPPAWVFPAVWAVLYALMGIGAARVRLNAEAGLCRRSMRLYLAQLAVNFLWPVLFFTARAYGAAFLWLVLLWTLIVWMTLTFREADRTAAWLQLPYLLWVFFAGYLNLGAWLLNR